MKYYFGQDGSFSLNLFGPIHILLILATIVAIILIYKNKEILKKYYLIKYIIGGILFANMVIFIVGAISTGQFDLKVHLPIHYCYITGFAFMYMIVMNKRNWFNWLYYAIFFCTITVIIFQDPTITYDRYEFILLVISHHFFLISCFDTLYILDYPVNKKGYKNFIIYTIIVYAIVFIINQLLNTDYIFNSTFPEFIYDYFPFINIMPPLIWLLLLSVPLLILAYLPIKFKNSNK